MRKNIIIFAGIVLLAAALIAMPASAGNGQGEGCHKYAEYQNSESYSYGTGQGTEYCYGSQNEYRSQNQEYLGYCLNNGTCTESSDGTGTKYCYGNGGQNSGSCPCL